MTEPTAPDNQHPTPPPAPTPWEGPYGIPQQKPAATPAPAGVFDAAPSGGVSPTAPGPFELPPSSQQAPVAAYTPPESGGAYTPPPAPTGLPGYTPPEAGKPADSAYSPTPTAAPPTQAGYQASYPPYQGPYQAPGGLPYYANPQATAKNGLGIAALVCGIGSFVVLPFLAGLAAVILGHMGLSASKRGEADNRGMSIAGLVLGYINVGLSVILLVFIVLAISAASTLDYTVYDMTFDAAGGLVGAR